MLRRLLLVAWAWACLLLLQTSTKRLLFSVVVPHIVKRFEGSSSSAWSRRKRLLCLRRFLFLFENVVVATCCNSDEWALGHWFCMKSRSDILVRKSAHCRLFENRGWHCLRGRLLVSERETSGLHFWQIFSETSHSRHLQCLPWWLLKHGRGRHHRWSRLIKTLSAVGPGCSCGGTTESVTWHLSRGSFGWVVRLLHPTIWQSFRCFQRLFLLKNTCSWRIRASVLASYWSRFAIRVIGRSRDGDFFKHLGQVDCCLSISLILRIVASVAALNSWRKSCCRFLHLNFISTVCYFHSLKVV